MLGILGGSGLTQFAGLEVVRHQVVRTPYGEPSGALVVGILGGREVVFLARHGYGHTIPPHEVNYRANIWALRSAGVARVLAVATVGGIRADLGPGTLVVPDQIIDYTWGRCATFVEAGEGPVKHVDFTNPYCVELRRDLLEASERAGERVLDGGVYAATQGPRLETAAEIDRLERDGAHMVGMTGMPEAALARELDLRYAAIAVVANHAAGRCASRAGVSLADIAAALDPAMVRVRRILEQAAGLDGG